MVDFFTPDQIAMLSASTVRCDFLVKFEFASSTMRAWNGNTELVVAGDTYLPMFGFGQIDGLGMSGGTVSENVTLSLSGLPGQALDLLSVALDDTPEVDQQMLTIFLQLFTDEWQPAGTPIPIFRGFMQPPSVSRSAMQGTEGATQSISLTAENIFYSRSRPAYGRNTDRDQQARSPGDKFFGFVASLISKTITYPDY
ncbi:hypothetical protein [Aminobacter sp. MDW-2]|uniref:hypothetical protein n=1 Tax=Aminobacter sp. MDW-2 TaxID=2666139 RepID=UPI0012B03F4C|nr:hypothetical protein [Aminobacter sp. MDW-2]MRX33226.1 hypothetical protein [Aminobacter sp. MDW-2]QNH36846.1 hypothetical protein H5P29_13645 [Aminobacter sp. MDW-2]